MLMQKVARILWILAVSMYISPSILSAQIQSEAMADWVSMKDRMMKIAEAMPENKFSYRPTDPQRTYGEQILHVAGANVGFLGRLGGNAAAPAINRDATARAEILKALSDSFDYGTAVINEQSDETMLQLVDARFLGESTRARVVSFLLGHTWDIYGQMAVYLRLNDVVPPASQTP